MGTLADVVKPNFITVAPEDTLGEVAEKMTAQNVGAVLVKDYGRLIGILTERDMLHAMAARVHARAGGAGRASRSSASRRSHRASCPRDRSSRRDRRLRSSCRRSSRRCTGT